MATATMTAAVYGTGHVPRCICGDIAARWSDGTPITEPATCTDCHLSGRYFTRNT